MTAVFSHGRLRLYLLKLLAEGPKHGYELMRLLENRFLGLYAPSAGTIYPRLARLEAEGLVTHTAAGGRKVYEITGAGRAELETRADELASLEAEIHASVADLSTLATDIEREVSGSVQDIRRELREAAARAQSAEQAERSGRFGWQSGRAAWQAERSAWQAAHGRSGAAGQGEAADAKTEAPGAPEAPEAPGAAGAIDDLERAVRELAIEVGALARNAGVTDRELNAASTVVVSALTELRRLLRPKK